MFAFLKRSFLIILGLLLLVVFVWLAGPLFQFGPWRPLESTTARLALIGLIVGAWIVLRIVKRLRASKATDALLSAVTPQAQPEERLSPDAVKLRERFDEAVATLKTDQGGQSLYELPWYADHRRARVGQDDGAAQFRIEVPARATCRQGRAARRRRHAQLRLVVH
ncbi:MAG: hypothetical protein QM736_28255 [Vicinamibacterales bacterium]